MSDVSPSDFFAPPPDMIYCPKLPLGILLETTQSYFRVYNAVEECRKKKQQPNMHHMLFEPLLQDQLMRACIVIFAQMPEEERQILINYAAKTAIENPTLIPNVPNPSELFK